jgi:hypothetical protein
MPASLDNYVWQLTYKWATHTQGLGKVDLPVM